MAAKKRPALPRRKATSVNPPAMDAAVVWEAARALRDVDDKVREADVDDANDAWLMSGRVRPARRTRRA